MSIHPGNLAGKPPIGLKSPREPKAKKKRKPIPNRSKKRAAYMASSARAKGMEHMGRVKMLPCLVCGAFGSEFHHEHPDGPRDDMRGLPLCPRHHRREYGPGAYHYSPKAFYAAHGSSAELLARVDQLLRALDDDCLDAWI